MFIQKREFLERMLCIDAFLLIQTKTEGGSIDNETTEIAVIACLSSPDFAETTYTVEGMALIAEIKFSFKLESSIKKPQGKLVASSF